MKKQNFNKLPGNKAEKIALRKIQNAVFAQARMLEEGSYTDEEKLEQLDVFLNLNKFIENYKDLEPLMKSYFARKAKKEKFEVKYIEEMEK